MPSSLCGLYLNARHAIEELIHSINFDPDETEKLVDFLTDFAVQIEADLAEHLEAGEHIDPSNAVVGRTDRQTSFSFDLPD